ncbi:MAG: sugar ABC transporter substrate-binding protein [Butyrivibrio sp.]|jgi:multiple sugar transport system substrate-binding protein|nr:sugar ABC transporter substrate-binding protein [Butyrivibrio sp.]
MRRKVISGLLSVVLMTTSCLFVGCGSTTSSGSAGTSASVGEDAQSAESSASISEDATAKSDSADKVKITYAQWGNDTETAACQKVADKFNASQDKIEVEVLKIDYDNYISKLNTMATAGTLPDTAIMSEAGTLTFAKNGLLADISSMYGEGESKPLDSLTFKYQDKPVAYSAANEVLNLWYNQDLLKKVCDEQGLNISDVTPPASADKAWTWDDFVKTAQELTVDVNGNNALSPKFDPNNVDVYGCTVNTLPWQLEVWCKSNGGGFYSEDGKTCIINQKEATDAIQAVADLSLKYHCAPPISDASQALSTSLGSEKVVMATDGAWNVGTYLGPDAKFKYSVGVLPYFKDKVTICTGGPNVVFATTKHPEEAMTWLKWYYQEENSWSLIEAGTWMPILDKWYTDSTLTDKWINNPNFPDHDTYKSAVVDYAKNNSKSTAWYTVAGTDVFNTSLATALSYVWTGDKTAQQAMDEYYDELNGIFTENNQ